MLVYACGVLVLLAAQPTRGLLVIGAALAAVGLALRLWAAGHLEKNRSLTTTGPYAYVKHPLYLGTLLLMVGFTVAASGTTAPSVFLVVLVLPVFLAAFFAVYVPRKRRVEGERLRRRFGQAYERYAALVPDLVPRLRPVSLDRRRWRFERVVRNSEHLTAIAILAAFLYLVILYVRGR
jgi:protein-S-isoprenylcysteine O-methyltransferase Ste14